MIAPSLAAEQLGVVAGLRRREAQRRAPGLIVLSPDPAAEARAFEPVLQALDDLTPRIEIDQPGQCAFLTRGPSRYFGGDQSMSDRAARIVVDVLEGSTSVHVGTADGRFAALRAAALAEPNRARVVQAGASAAFLSSLPIGLLAIDDQVPAKRKQLEDLVDVLSRLGLTSLGSFAVLEVSDVIARFGAVGVRAHTWARGLDDRPASPEDPPAELEVSIDLDPPVQRVDQAAFVAKALAEEFIRKLGGRGISCARVAIVAESEHGETQLRLWRSEEAFSAPAISDRMRWQLDGWLSGPVRLRPTGGLVRLVLRPDDISVAAGRQLGFWGEQTGLAERAARSVARVQGIVGVGVARVPEIRGGRNPGDRVVAIAVESVDLVERSTAPDRKAGAETASAIAGVAADGVMVGGTPQQWIGELPAPAPTTVHAPPILIEVLDARRAAGAGDQPRNHGGNTRMGCSWPPRAPGNQRLVRSMAARRMLVAGRTSASADPDAASPCRWAGSRGDLPTRPMGHRRQLRLGVVRITRCARDPVLKLPSLQSRTAALPGESR